MGVADSHFSVLAAILTHPFSFLSLPRKEASVAMAEAPGPVEKGLEELEEQITCPVCQEHFRDPKILPCLHYYCKECVRQLAFQAGLNGPFACPECRKGTVLPQNDPDQLPTAFFVNRMKELRTKMMKAQGRTEAICELYSGAKVEAFCRQCAELICSDCVRSHRMMKMFATHEVVTLQELKQGRPKEIPLKEATPRAKTMMNSRRSTALFAITSFVEVVSLAITQDTIKFEFVNKSAPWYKKTISKNLVPLAKIQTNISAATREVEEVEREVSEQYRHVANTIKYTFKQLHEILHN